MAVTVTKSAKYTKLATTDTAAEVQTTMDEYNVDIERAIIIHDGTNFFLFWQP